jgi:hypothetical protein
MFFFVELEPSLKLDFLACDADFAREVYKL